MKQYIYKYVFGNSAYYVDYSGELQRLNVSKGILPLARRRQGARCREVVVQCRHEVQCRGSCG